PDTAQSYNNLAIILAAEGRRHEAEEQLRHAADAYAHVRPRTAASGLERAIATGRQSPLAFLAVLLAQERAPQEAWQRVEQRLGRGIWDALTARLAYAPSEQAHLAELARRLDRLDLFLSNYGALQQPTEEQTRQHKERLTERRQTQEELDSLT